MQYTTEPYDHQREALERAYAKPEFAFFLEQGTGKSKIIVDEIVNLIDDDKIDIAVIIAPNQVHENWAEQFSLHGQENKYNILIFKSKLNYDKLLKQANELWSEKPLIILINIDVFSTAKGLAFIYSILASKPSYNLYLAVDESHKIKTPGAIRTKNILLLSKKADYRRIATGTEAQEGLEGLYSQMKFLNGNIIGINSFTAFRNMYCEVMNMETGRGQIYQKITGYRNQDRLAASIAPYVYQKRKADCLDLPDKVYITHYIQMTAKQKLLYSKMVEDLIISMGDGTIIDVTQALTRMMKLQQVLCGHVIVEDKSMLVPSLRADYCVELIEAANKTIVFCRFINDTIIVSTALDKAGIGSVVVNGRVTNRLEMINQWRTDKNKRALIMTIQTGGTGLTLNEANNVIFYSNVWSSTDRIQAEDRNHRIGQESKVTYHDIVVRNMVDHKLLLALQQKSNIAQMFRSLLDVKAFLLDNNQ